MCVDYTDLNKVCKKYPFVLPRIDQVVDSTEPSKFSRLLSGCHQTPLKDEDQIKTSFITLFDAFCYKTMPFGLFLPAGYTTVSRFIAWVQP
jgi:hypothetical protein